MKNKYEIRGDQIAIFITHKGDTMECLIDSCDLGIVSYGSWSASWNRGTKSFYARGPHPVKAGSKIRMHQLLCETTSDRPFVDHDNHNTLDNRRLNLSAKSRSENGLNRKGAQSNHRHSIRGAYFYKHMQKWQARVKFRGTAYYFGYHNSAELAGAAAINGRMRLVAGERIAKVAYRGREPEIGAMEIEGRI